MDTDQVIARLVSDTGPVRRLPPPWLRAAAWLAIGLAAAALSVAVMGTRPDLAAKLQETRYVAEQAAALLTAATAALVAFMFVVPGRARGWILLPCAPLVVWLASIGVACAVEIRRGSVAFESDWSCLPAIALVGAIPAIAMVLMLRRGAPLLPYHALGLGALAAASIGDFGLRLFHAIDAGLMVLTWQMGSVVVLALALTHFAPTLLRWRHAAFQVEKTPQADAPGSRRQRF